MVQIIHSLPSTGFYPPTADEAGRLLRIVAAAHPWLRLVESVELREFRLAMRASGLMYRVAEPVSKYPFSHYVDSANDMLQSRWGAPSISGNAMMGAILAHNDIPWRRHNPSVGQLLEVGLDVHSGRQCENRWRDLLTGERTLLEPVPARRDFVERATAGRSVSYRVRTVSGERPLADTEPLWN